MRFADNSFVSNPGDPVHIIYKPVIDKDGCMVLEVAGKENTDEIIQSFAESTDMSFILAKLAQGDTSVLNRNTPLFGDFTNMPKSYAEMLQLQIDSKKAFDSLSAEMKNKFDNDPNQFFVQAGTEDWYNKLGIGVEVDEKKESEVSE